MNATPNAGRQASNPRTRTTAGYSPTATEWARQQRGVPPFALRVLETLARHVNEAHGLKTGVWETWVSMATIARELNCLEQQVVRALRQLRDAGLVIRTEHGGAVPGRNYGNGGRSNTYRLPVTGMEPALDRAAPTRREPRGGTRNLFPRGDAQSVSPGDAQSARGTRTREQERLEQEPPLPPLKTRVGSTEPVSEGEGGSYSPADIHTAAAWAYSTYFVPGYETDTGEQAGEGLRVNVTRDYRNHLAELVNAHPGASLETLATFAVARRERDIGKGYVPGDVLARVIDELHPITAAPAPTPVAEEPRDPVLAHAEQAVAVLEQQRHFAGRPPGARWEAVPEMAGYIRAELEAGAPDTYTATDRALHRYRDDTRPPAPPKPEPDPAGAILALAGGLFARPD